MTCVSLAFYKGTDEWLDRLTQWWTRSAYSHCELVIDGLAYSSSPRDGGVRVKAGIDFTSAHWDVIHVRAHAPSVCAWFEQHARQRYDYVGLLGFVLPWHLGSRRAWFCSEACAAALGLREPETFDPGRLANYAKVCLQAPDLLTPI